jgi:hypothetical protein
MPFVSEFPAVRLPPEIESALAGLHRGVMAREEARLAALVRRFPMGVWGLLVRHTYDDGRQSTIEVGPWPGWMTFYEQQRRLILHLGG